MADPVLIIGAGVAGLTAAVELADSGIEVVLVEKKNTIGGNALDLYKAFPTDDCFYCFEGNRWRSGIRKCFYRCALLDQPNISLKTGTTVKNISGAPGQFEVTLHSEPHYIDPVKCTMCGVCLDISNAFYLVSPQCQPQAVSLVPERVDEKTKLAAEKCPTGAINLDAKPIEETLSVSDIVIATGYHEMRPVNIEEYGYGRYPNVITQLELARMLDPNGETNGQIIRPTDGKPAKRIMMVQCVGSRDEKYYPYCSKICCVFALKHANILAQEREGIQITVIYMDIRTYNRHERYYRDARQRGVNFIRGRIHSLKPLSEGSLEVVVYDSLLDTYFKDVVDLFVLSSALEPSEDSDRIMELLNVKSSYGFVSPQDVVTGIVVVGDHVYACGAALGPAEVPESVTQARAVASKIIQSRK